MAKSKILRSLLDMQLEWKLGMHNSTRSPIFSDFRSELSREWRHWVWKCIWQNAALGNIWTSCMHASVSILVNTECKLGIWHVNIKVLFIYLFLSCSLTKLQLGSAKAWQKCNTESDIVSDQSCTKLTGCIEAM